MEHYAGIDVSLESASICIVDASGRIMREAKVASEPDFLIGWFGGLGIAVARIGLEAGPLSQWLCAGIRDVELPVELLETRHVRAAFKAWQAGDILIGRLHDKVAEDGFWKIRHVAGFTGKITGRDAKPVEPVRRQSGRLCSRLQRAWLHRNCNTPFGFFGALAGT